MSEWEQGDGCPHCGASHIREFHLQGEIARHHNGRSEFAGSGDRLATVMYQCDECETTLSRMTDGEIAELMEDFE